MNMDNEIQQIRAAVKSIARAESTDGLTYSAPNPRAALMSILRALKSAGWTSGFVCQCAEGEKSLTLFPPGSTQPSRGVMFGKTVPHHHRSYTVLMKRQA